MTQMEILILGLTKALAFPVGAVAIVAVLYGLNVLRHRWTRRVWNLR